MVGDIVSKERIDIDPEKIETLLETPFPTTKHKVIAFFKITSYHRRFIERYVMIVKPLGRFLKDNVIPPQAMPNALGAFEKLEQTLLSAPILQTSNREKLFLVFTGALGEKVGATFTQLDEEGYDHPIYYASLQLTLAQMNYMVMERERLRVNFRLKIF